MQSDRAASLSEVQQQHKQVLAQAQARWDTEKVSMVEAAQQLQAEATEARSLRAQCEALQAEATEARSLRAQCEALQVEAEKVCVNLPNTR
jgi:hypothetical protein